LHASLLLMMVAHVERVTSRTLCLELQFCRLRHRHLVVGKGSSSRVANTRCVAAILVYIELLLHIVVGSGVVCGQEIRSDLVG
jgi:hypothetical protein